MQGGALCILKLFDRLEMDLLRQVVAGASYARAIHTRGNNSATETIDRSLSFLAQIAMSSNDKSARARVLVGVGSPCPDSRTNTATGWPPSSRCGSSGTDG
jgi:hypothetical protein